MFGKYLIAPVIVAALAIVALGCTGTGTPTQTLPASGTGSLRVTVQSSDGSPLAGAKVISNTQPDGQLKVTGSTGQDGAVTYKDIKAGDYEFYISRFDYEQKQFSVTVVADKVTGITITLNHTPTPSPVAP